jgi:hypothetical protein
VHAKLTIYKAYENMSGFYLNAEEISVAVIAFSHFPERTPGRWNLVSQLMKEMLRDSTNSVRFPIGRQCQIFECSSEHCRYLYRLLTKEFHLLFNIEERKHEITHGKRTSMNDAFKPLIMPPSVERCVQCGSNLQIRNVPTFPVVYTRLGTTIAAMFEGKCRSCDVAHYNSYYIDKRRNKKLYYEQSQQKYFHITIHV